jgi:metallo-beta-lactamase family protein
LKEGDKQVRIFGALYDVKADVETIDGLSAHAGQDFLLQYALAVKNRAKKIFLVHGEPQAAGVFEEKLRGEGIKEIEYPAQKTVVEL